MIDPIAPRIEYSTRLKERRKTVAVYERYDRQVALLRLVAAGVFFGMAWLALWNGSISSAWLVAPVAGFVILLMAHDRVARAQKRAEMAAEFYEDGLARIEDRWIGRGASAEVFRDESHLYAPDLDIFGKASLFELLCTARTRSGEETLASWLAAPADRSEILKRQTAIEELRNRLDLREDLAVLGSDIRSTIHPDLMTRWGTESPIRISRWSRALMGVLTIVTFVILIFGLSYAGQPLWPLAFAAEAAVGLVYRNRVRRIMAGVERPEKELELLSMILHRIEVEPFSSKLLRDLKSALSTAGVPPSRQIGRLARMTDMLNWRRNLLFAPLSVIFFWATHLALAIESWRQRCGPFIEPWLKAIGEFESLCALSGFAYEHPDDPFPEIAEDGPIFEGNEMRHPLIPFATCVPNTVRAGGVLRLLVVSGSNMSGKSTLLRTVGINAVLALTGAPVRARSLRISPLAIGATLRIQDSLQAGTSRFYAEIQRIHRIMEMTRGRLPVLFLLDEVLHGTNSRDRAIGAEAIVKGLIDRGAIGLVTTHDLALASVAETLSPRAINVHFEDEMVDGRMVFDYRMRPGIVEKSNALALMRSVGLDV